MPAVTHTRSPARRSPPPARPPHLHDLGCQRGAQLGGDVGLQVLAPVGEGLRVQGDLRGRQEDKGSEGSGSVLGNAVCALCMY